MRSYTFEIFGHKNTQGSHKTTLEFTKDDFLTLQGDCIIGINANYKKEELLHFRGSRVKIEFIQKEKTLDSFTCYIPEIISLDRNCIVMRKSDYIDSRTFGIRSDKVANDINRDVIAALSDENSVVKVKIYEY